MRDTTSVQTMIDYDTAQAFEEAAEAADVQIRTGYSGRGMFGARCVGVVGSSSAVQLFLVELAIELARASQDQADDTYVELARDMARNTSTDNMGYDTIAYWPSIQWPADED